MPCRRPPAPRPDPLVPSGPSGTLRTGGPGVLSVICVGSLSGLAEPPTALELSRVKLLSPLRVRNGCFGAFSGCRGDVGFNGGLYGASRGVIGFMRIRLRVVGGASAPVSCNSPAWRRRGRCSRWYGAQTSDHLGEKPRKRAASGEVVCVLGATVSGVVCWLHANPLLRVLIRYIARKPAIESVGGAAQARISGLTCGLEGPCAYWRVNVRLLVVDGPIYWQC